MTERPLALKHAKGDCLEGPMSRHSHYKFVQSVSKYHNFYYSYDLCTMKRYQVLVLIFATTGRGIFHDLAEKSC